MSRTCSAWHDLPSFQLWLNLPCENLGNDRKKENITCQKLPSCILRCFVLTCDPKPFPQGSRSLHGFAKQLTPNWLVMQLWARRCWSLIFLCSETDRMWDPQSSPWVSIRVVMVIHDDWMMGPKGCLPCTLLGESDDTTWMPWSQANHEMQLWCDSYYVQTCVCICDVYICICV